MTSNFSKMAITVHSAARRLAASLKTVMEFGRLLCYTCKIPGTGDFENALSVKSKMADAADSGFLTPLALPQLWLRTVAMCIKSKTAILRVDECFMSSQNLN